MNPSLRRAACLFATLLSAKIAIVILRASDGARTIAPALLGIGAESALLAAAFGAIDLLAARAARGRGAERLVRRGSWSLYAGVALYAAINVPVTRVFASPLTASMREAAGTAITDSMALYVTFGTVAACAFVLLVATVTARVMSAPGARAIAALALASLAAAPFATRAPFARDPIFTLVETELARVTAPSAPVAGGGDQVVAEIDDTTRGLDLRYLEGEARGRHVVWIVLESTGARYLGLYGASPDPMPNLTALARAGVVFDNAYAVYPESIKGLYAMLCSFSPAPHTSARAYAASRLPCRSIADVLAADGYRTALFHSGRFAYLGMNHVVERRGFELLADAKSIGGKHASSFGTDDLSTANAVLARFDARKPGERVLTTYMPIAGHHPYESPGEGPRPFGETSELDRYRSDLFRGDLALGALVDGLKARGLFEETVFVIHGDHGEAFFQHEGNFAHTHEVYDENLHVPFAIVAPGAGARGVRARQLVSLLDVAPTIAALVGLPRDAGWEGRSALEPGPRVIRALADKTTQKLAARSGRFKLVLDVDADRVELFDLARDPLERVDLSSADPARVAAMRSDLLHWSERQRSILASR